MSSFFFLFHPDAATFLLGSLAFLVECCSNSSSCEEQMLKFLFFILMMPFLSSQHHLQGYSHLLLFHSCLPPLHFNFGKDKVNFDYCSHSNKTQHNSAVSILCSGQYCKFFIFTEVFYPHKTVEYCYYCHIYFTDEQT